MRTAFLVSLAIALTAAPAFSQTIADCKKITTAIERLDCFDKLPAGNPNALQSPTEPKPESPSTSSDTLIGKTILANVAYQNDSKIVDQFGNESAATSKGTMRIKLTFAKNGDVFSYEPGAPGSDFDQGNIYKLNAGVDFVRDRARANPIAFKQFHFSSWKARTVLANNQFTIRVLADQTGLNSKIHLLTNIDWVFKWDSDWKNCLVSLRTRKQAEGSDISKTTTMVSGTGRCTIQ